MVIWLQCEHMETRDKNKKPFDFNRLLKIRQELHLSQREMADELGVVHGAIGLWETGKRKIPGPVVKLIELYEEELGLHEHASAVDLVEELESTWLARTVKLCNTGAKVTSKLMLDRFRGIFGSQDESNRIRRKTQIAVAKQIVDTLGTLKGLPHKLGQLISYMDVEAPAEVKDIYATLQHLAPPMAPSVVADVIVSEFKKTPNQLFASWNQIPFAAASIGQVHLATTRGNENVAVKIQYPRIKEILRADLKNAALLDQIGSVIVRNHKSGNLMEELSERFLNECDYKLEAQNQMEMRSIYSKTPGIIIPKVFFDLSSDLVLTMEYFEGKKFSEFRKESSQKEKDRAAQIIWDYAFESSIKHRIFNGDPHPGNYLFQDHGIVFLDYGCVKRLSPKVSTEWKKFLWGIAHDKRDVVKEAIFAMDIVPQPKQFHFDVFYELMRKWYYPCYSKKPFTFTRIFVSERWEETKTKYTKIGKTCFPKEHLFLNQLQWGLYAILADLNATAIWSEHFLPLL